MCVTTRRTHLPPCPCPSPPACSMHANKTFLRLPPPNHCWKLGDSATGVQLGCMGMHGMYGLATECMGMHGMQRGLSAACKERLPIPPLFPHFLPPHTPTLLPHLSSYSRLLATPSVVISTRSHSTP